MPRLFIKIFLWFWLAMTLIGVILVTLAMTTNPRQAYLERQKYRLSKYGNQMIEAYEKKGQNGLNDEINRLYKKEGIRLGLIHMKTETLGQQQFPPHLREFALKALIDNIPRLPMREPPHRGRRNRPFVIPLDNNYVLLADLPRPSRLELILDPHALTLRLSVTFLIAGLICYLLTRSITTPIMKIREGAQAFADGNLATRVSPKLKPKKGELADLANDFDTMAERIETLLQSQHRLQRDISHELRSPLARLNIALELARQNNPKNSAPLDRIEIESERLNELIGQLLTINQLESQTEITEKKRINLNDLLGKIVANANYESQGDEVKANLTINKHVVLDGSEELLFRAIENVVRNALLYTAKDSTVEVLLETSPDGSLAEITVIDQGPGVPEKALTELFRPFYRVGEARDRQSGGTGVGLAIAERAIRLHGGKISATNPPNGGLLVSIHLPLNNT